MRDSRFIATDVMRQDTWQETVPTTFPQPPAERNGLGEQGPQAQNKTSQIQDWQKNTP